MGEERGCCDKCAKAFIMAINILIILIGGAILGAGIYWQLSPTGFYKEIFNHNIFNVPIISMALGSLLLLVGLTGFMGACCEVLMLLKAYMGFLILIMLVEIILAVGCVAMKSTVETYASNRTRELMGYYGDKTADEKGILAETIDLVQKNFDCCGVTGPAEWATVNTIYKNNTVPDSCCKSNMRKSLCGTSKVWTDNTDTINTSGCKTSIWNFVKTNLLYIGIVAGAIVILQLSLLIMVSRLRVTIEDEDYLGL